MLIVGLLLAVMIGFSFWIAGVFITAQGQLLTTLSTTIRVERLTDEELAEAARLLEKMGIEPATVIDQPKHLGVSLNVSRQACSGPGRKANGSGGHARCLRRSPFLVARCATRRESGACRSRRRRDGLTAARSRRRLSP